MDTVILYKRRGHRDYGDFDLGNIPEENEDDFRALLRAQIDAGNAAQNLLNFLEYFFKIFTLKFL